MTLFSSLLSVCAKCGIPHTHTLTSVFFFIFSDSAPGGQQVSEQFNLDWDSVLVSSDNVIVVHLDGRGSSFQGQKILQDVHKRLGVVDLQDQLAALE